MKTLKFDPSLVKLVMDGSKIATWRIFDDKDLSVGDKLDLIDSSNQKVFAKAEIIKVKEKKIGDIEETDFYGHEKFPSREAMLKTYQSYYGKQVTWNTMVKMVDFKIIK